MTGILTITEDQSTATEKEDHIKTQGEDSHLISQGEKPQEKAALQTP